jgi:hypothetical protein
MRKHQREPMAQRTVKPERVKTLREWVARWPKATNLGFDEVTREPTIFSADDARSHVGSFPWRREGDTITIITQPAQFSQKAVEVARNRYERVKSVVPAEAEEALRGANQQLLETWRAYEAATPAVRASMRRDILTAERAVRELEEGIASRVRPDRAFYTVDGLNRVYSPPMPTARRGIALNVMGGDADVEPTSSEKNEEEDEEYGEED